MRRFIIFLIIFFITLDNLAFSKEIQKLQGKRLLYGVYFNGIHMGRIELEYLEKENIGTREVDVISIDSHTEILQIFKLESKEKVFLDSRDHLPIKVERDTVFFGKKESIREIYVQDKGFVKITRSNSKDKEEFIYQDRPIHNILGLLYSFPKDIDLESRRTFAFNLPTQKVKIEVLGERTLSTKVGDRKVYFIFGRGARRFNLWVDKEERIPLRLEFILPLGKVVILRRD